MRHADRHHSRSIAVEVAPERLAITILCGSFSDTQLLRTQSLALLCEHLGHSVDVVTTEPGEVLSSLRRTPFAESLRVITHDDLRARVLHHTDLLYTVKAVGPTLGQGRRLARQTGTAHLVDIDDPDIEVRTIHARRTAPRNAVFLLRGWRSLPEQGQLALAARRSRTTVSNPVLQSRWGGTVIPHARTDPGPGAEHERTAPHVAFVGSVRPHKGLGVLRAAFDVLGPRGWSLLVTAERPADARPWETWTGEIDGTMDTGQLTAEADVVVTPSDQFSWSLGQLPLKLIDAMLLGRAVVVSDVGPLPWAVGAAGAVFPAGSVGGLVEALRPLEDPQLRRRRGELARELALERYTVERIAPSLGRALQLAVRA